LPFFCLFAKTILKSADCESGLAEKCGKFFNFTKCTRIYGGGGGSGKYLAK
jgi:hypothetical protein